MSVSMQPFFIGNQPFRHAVRPKVDAHVHIDTIDPESTHHTTRPPTPQELGAYIKREGLTGVFAIYEREAVLQQFRSLDINLTPVYWVRDPLKFKIPKSAQGIKLHPYLDQYGLNLATLKPVLEEANRKGLFVLVHMEDRKPEISRPRQMLPLAQAYPNIKFVLAHAGSYDPPGRVRLKPEFQERFRAMTTELVNEAVAMARLCPNIYLETSIMAHPEKARLIAKAPVDKLLLGTDFPILSQSRPQLQSLAFQEAQLLRAGLKPADIMRIHQNANTFAVSGTK